MPNIDPNVADGLLDVPKPVVPADTEPKEPQAPQEPQEPKAPAEPEPKSPQEPKAPANEVLDFDIADSTKELIDNLAGATGVDATKAIELAKDALASGNVQDINRDMYAAVFGDKASAALAIATAVVKDTAAVINSAKEYVYSKVGGEAEWQTLAGTFKATSSAEEVQAVQTLLNSKHFDTAIRIMQTQVAGSGAVIKKGNMLEGQQQTAQQGLSSAEFGTKLQELQQKYRGRSLETGAAAEEYQALLSQRQLGIKINK